MQPGTTFGERLGQLMNDYRFTTIRLAGDLQTSAQTVYSWLANESVPSMAWAPKLCGVFNCEPNDLLEGVTFEVGEETD